MSPVELRASLRDPLLLNLVCALFALDRLYGVIGSDKVPNAWGHGVAVIIYTVGFLVALLATDKDGVLLAALEPDEGKSDGRARAKAKPLKLSDLRDIATWRATGWSYFCLALGSIALLVFVGFDAAGKRMVTTGPS